MIQPTGEEQDQAVQYNSATSFEGCDPQTSLQVLRLKEDHQANWEAILG